MAKKKRGYYLGLLAFIIIVLAVSFPLWMRGIARFLIINNPPKPAQVIVILGGWKKDRIEHAVKLYKQGYAPRILATGEKINLPRIEMTWPALAKKEAVSRGVPAKSIIVEERSTSTYEDALYVLEDMERLKLRSAIIVSDPPHMRRVAFSFKKLSKNKDISLIFSPVPLKDSYFKLDRWWSDEESLEVVFSEYLKLVLYFFKYSF